MRPRSTTKVQELNANAVHQGNPGSHDSHLPNRPLLTTGETAALLRTSRKAVYALIERRQIPGVVRLGRRVLVRSDVLIDWLRQKSESHR